MWGLDDEEDTTQKWQDEYAREVSPNTSQTCTAGRSYGYKTLDLLRWKGDSDIEWGF